MKTKILILLVSLSVMAIGARADTVWDSGHHEIFEGDEYWEIYIYNNATADMFGGNVYKVETFVESIFDFIGGEMDLLYVHESSDVNIYGGILSGLGAIENSTVNLYAYNVVHHPTGGHFNRGWIEGLYLSDDSYFSFNLDDTNTFSHINIIPEPTAFVLLGFGGLFLRKRRCCN